MSNSSNSTWSKVKRHFFKNKPAVISMYFVIFLGLTAIFADFIANDRPIYAYYKDSHEFPAVKSIFVKMGISKWSAQELNRDWKKIEISNAIWPLVRYTPSSQASLNQEDRKPSQAHLLGTDVIGRDVLAGLIHGTRIAFQVGFVSMSIAFVLGVFFGGIAGFFGDNNLQMSRASLIALVLGLFLAFFYGFFIRGAAFANALNDGFLPMLGQLLLSLIITALCIGFAYLLKMPLSILPFLRKKVFVPLDILITRLIELVVSIPTLILILAIIAITRPSLTNIMIIIGLTGWTGIARFVRAEMLRIRSLSYIEASRSLGYSSLRSLFKHALPNALSPVFITLAFGMAGSILTESFLSFLGIGVPAEIVTWGSLLSEARSNHQAWWLAIYPGVAIFLTVTAFNLIGEGLTDALDPKK